MAKLHCAKFYVDVIMTVCIYLIFIRGNVMVDARALSEDTAISGNIYNKVPLVNIALTNTEQ